MDRRYIKAFNELYGEDWLCWLGQPMLYDGALFVERDERTPEIEKKVKRSLRPTPHKFS